METWRWPLPGLILLSLTVLAAVLLIAGYGLPVGISLLIGLVLGLVVGAITGFWLFRPG
jgi:xanthine/uracil permease